MPSQRDIRKIEAKPRRSRRVYYRQLAQASGARAPGFRAERWPEVSIYEKDYL